MEVEVEGGDQYFRFKTEPVTSFLFLLMHVPLWQLYRHKSCRLGTIFPLILFFFFFLV